MRQTRLVSDLSDACARAIRLISICAEPRTGPGGDEGVEEAPAFPCGLCKRQTPKGQDEPASVVSEEMGIGDLAMVEAMGQEGLRLVFMVLLSERHVPHPRRPIRELRCVAAAGIGQHRCLQSCVLNPIHHLTPAEDYTAEKSIADRSCARDDGWAGPVHMLSYLGPSWCQKPPRFQAAQVVPQHPRYGTSKGCDLGFATAGNYGHIRRISSPSSRPREALTGEVTGRGYEDISFMFGD